MKSCFFSFFYSFSFPGPRTYVPRVSRNKTCPGQSQPKIPSLENLWSWCVDILVTATSQTYITHSALAQVFRHFSHSFPVLCTLCLSLTLESYLTGWIYVVILFFLLSISVSVLATSHSHITWDCRFSWGNYVTVSGWILGVEAGNQEISWLLEKSHTQYYYILCACD